MSKFIDLLNKNRKPRKKKIFNWIQAIRDSLYWSASRRAKDDGIEFTITKDDIIIPDVCPVFKRRFLRKQGYPTDNSPTLDRIDNSKGYIPGNIQVISLLANRMKSNASREDLLQFSEWIKQTYI
jgi:hypothetical protein